MKLSKLFLISIFFISATFTNKVKACVDYHPTIFVTCDYDATYSEILIRVHNMQLFGSPDGVFCTCGISNHTDVFTNINYVAFVEPETVNPIAGFVPWDANAPAAASWDALEAGDWDAFLAETTAAGLITGDPVELIIRATLPPGYTATLLDSNLVVSELGTDEFDNTAGELAESHNSISNFISGGPITYNELPLAYFTAIDNHIATVNSVDENTINITVYPNPTQDIIYLNVTDEALGSLNNIKITDVNGKLILEEKFQPEIVVSHLPKGLYFIKVETEGDNDLFYRFVKE
ncbi:MAG: hypothetical protein ACI8ZM_002040 [Crocinitomix sp.]|jgi:hypothetical protein